MANLSLNNGIFVSTANCKLDLGIIQERELVVCDACQATGILFVLGAFRGFKLLHS